MTAPILATRAMKARRNSICAYCRGLIRRGDRIALMDTWVHARCAIERQHDHQENDE
jgi:hypothetical protein